MDAGVVEESLVLIPTPQSMVSEGIAETAWELVDAATRDDVTAVLVDAGVAFDAQRSAAVEEARRPLRSVGLNAALMLHEDGASEAEAVDYVERWSARPRGVRAVERPVPAGPAAARVRGDVLPRRRPRPAARPGEPGALPRAAEGADPRGRHAPGIVLR